MNYCKLSVIIFTALFFSCQNNQKINEISNINKSLEYERVLNIQEIIFKGESNYSKYFNNNVNVEISYSSTREHPMNTRDFSANVDYLHEKISNNRPLVTINNKTIENIRSFYSSSSFVEQLRKNPVECSQLNYFYGRKVNFSVNKDMFEMYVPKTIEILYPKSHKEYFPICYFDRYKLRWEKDVSNSNGVVISVEWFGQILGEADTENYIRRIDIVNDNGETLINSHMFDKIPHLAIVKVTIARGNIDIIEKKGITYKIQGISEASLYTIIARENLED